MKLSKNQQAIITAMTAGAELYLSKRFHDYGKYFLIQDGIRTPVNANTAGALYRAKVIKVGGVTNLTAKFIL